MHVEFEGAVGRLEGLLDTPRAAEADSAPARAAVVLAHPHPSQGGTMHTKAVFQAAKGLVRIGCAVLRFNFRGVGSSFGIFDHGKGETEDFAIALNLMATRYPGTPLWTAGFSFGSWVALETGAADPRVSVLIGIAPPVARDEYSFPHTLETA
jgi:alpha/beta superfamily hydrolase